MSDFNVIKSAVNKQMDEMVKTELFRVDVNKDELWDTYLKKFPPGANPKYKERTEHDCQCCKQFIRSAGGVVSIVNNKLVSIWDIDVGGYYQVVADALSALVKSKVVDNAFRHFEKHLGTDHNHQMLESGETIKWSHFHYELPRQFVMRDAGTVLSEMRSNKEVFKRSLDEITRESVETVLELIEQNSIYRGEEHKSIVELMLKHKKEYVLLDDEVKDNYCWIVSVAIGGAAKIRNTAIGTLLVDISDGVALDDAVKMFESKVAPTNYKRPTALITKAMITRAQDKVKELGIEESLQRRYAVTEDVTVNNVLFADRSVRKSMNVFDEMADETPDKIKNLDKVEEVDINTFLEFILPKAESIELMVENRHSNNMMSLIAPVEPEAKRIFKWDNNFSWAYSGEVADSMKQRVKKAGGNVDGILRFSIQWNDGDNNQNDFDAHCIEPNRNLISYPTAGRVQPSSGILDVDIINPGKNVAVENITWTDLLAMQAGKYEFIVHNYSGTTSPSGFTAEIEYDGQVYSYSYAKKLRGKEKVKIATIIFSKEDGVEFVESLPSSVTSREIWGISTQKFHKVSMVMNSPNHWDGKTTGNKHLFFIVDKCHNDKPARGFFNEFLKEDLTEHRKVFEVLGSKMKTEPSENQLSGLGFSSTQRNHIFCKISGSFKRIIKINL